MHPVTLEHHVGTIQIYHKNGEFVNTISWNVSGLPTGISTIYNGHLVEATSVKLVIVASIYFVK